MSWYKTNAREQIDARLPLLAMDSLRKGIKDFGDGIYSFAGGESDPLKIAKINADAKIKVSNNDIKIAGINFDRDRYKVDKEYKKAVDTAIINAKAKNKASNAKIAAANINAKAKKYFADVNERNSKRTYEVKKLKLKQKTKPKLSPSTKMIVDEIGKIKID